MDYNSLLSSLSERLNLTEPLVPDVSGSVMLECDGKPVTITAIEEADALTLSCAIAPPPPEAGLEKLYRSLLEANHQLKGGSGASFSIDPESGDISLLRVLPLGSLEPDGLFSALESFANALVSWRGIVENFRNGLDASGGESESLSDEPPPPFGVFA